MPRKNILRGATGETGIELVGTATDKTGSPDLSVNISGIDIEDGDVGIFFVSCTHFDADHTVSGWTELADSNRGGTVLTVWARSMLSTDTTVATSGLNIPFSTQGIGAVLIFRGCDLPTAASDVAQTEGANSGSPNPTVAPAATSAGDWVLATCQGDTSTSRTVPSGYTEIYDDSCTGGNIAFTSVGWIEGDGTAEDPPAFSVSPNAVDWSCCTINLEKS